MSTDDTVTPKEGVVDALDFLNELIGESETFGAHLAAVRKGEELSQTELAAKLGVSRSHLCDIEKGRKLVGPERAARFAEVLGYLPASFVQLVLQDHLDRAKLDMQVNITAAAS